MIIVECPQCNTALRIPKKYAGQFGKCKQCGGRLHVPNSISVEDDNWIHQAPAPILPRDEPTLATLPSNTPDVIPVVSPPVYEPTPFTGDQEEPVSYRRRHPKRKKKDGIDKQFLLGLVGSVALCVGVFAPLLSAPIVGSQNLFANSQEMGGIVLLTGVASLGVVLVKKYEALWLTGLGGLAMTVLAFLNFYKEKKQIKLDSQDDPYFAEAASAMADILQIEWGWAVLLVGSILLIACAAIHDERT